MTEKQITKEQIPVLAASLVEHQNEFNPLSAGDAQWVIQETKTAIALMVRAIKDRKLVEPLLEFVGKVDIPAITEKFITKDHFVEDTSEEARVKISWLGDNFKSWFLEKEEEPIAAKNLQYWKLVKNSVDTPIIAELGGEAKAKTTLSCLSYLLGKQRNGEKGVLLTNGRANIFYICDITGALRAVNAYWSGDGWNGDAGSVEDPRSWGAGHQVFFSNS
ncbi:MAG: hypothetical protein V1684_00450 [bacterium]